MQINIETYGTNQMIDVVTVKAHGEQDGKALLNKVMAPEPKPAPKAPIVGREAESECTLRTAAALFRAMQAECGNMHSAQQAAKVADVLEQLADGNKKIQCIKAVREFSGLGLREAKEMTERLGPFAPKPSPY